MTPENSQPQEVDLDRTDVLPVLQGVSFDPDIADDAVKMDETAMLAVSPVFSKLATHGDFARASSVDLPSLAESLRSVEDRISRQNADYEALHRNYEKAQEAEASAFTRAGGLATELTTVRAALEAEQNRVREATRTLADKNTSIETALGRLAESERRSERQNEEIGGLRQAAAAREANLAQVLHSLGERDAQLSALQREHAKVVPQLEARSSSNAQLETELRDARGRIESLGHDLQTHQRMVSTLTAQVGVVESQLESTRGELGSTKSRAGSFLERLQTREWRLGFSHNLFRELDTEVGVATSRRDALRAERDQLSRQVANLEAKMAGYEADIAKLRENASHDASGVADLTRELQRNERTRAEFGARIEALDKERRELTAEVEARDRALADLKTAVAAQTQRAEDALTAQSAKTAEMTARVAQLQAELAERVAQLQGENAAHITQVQSDAAARIEQLQAETAARVSTLQGDSAARIAQLEVEATAREQGMAVLVAHLHEARKPLEPIEAEVRRLTDELSHKRLLDDKLNEENRDLRAALERTRGALEEREFLIRRLERSESNNAAVLGRIQTSIEKLGSVPGVAVTAGPVPEYAAELVRIDGDHAFSHALGRRTRIGRAASCELQIESSSVSRQHALILLGRREVIIEDLNSTNGVMVNGRKISRQMLNDGDLVMIGDIKFRLAVKPAPNPPDAQLAAPMPG